MPKQALFFAVVFVVTVWGCGKSGNDRNTSTSSTRPVPPGITHPQGRLNTSLSTGQSNSAHRISSEDAGPRQTELMKKMGLEVKDGRIILDTEKSKTFFESLGRSIKKDIREGVEKAEKHVPDGEELGIKVENKKVVIDLNKTKNFMKAWVETMEVLGRELNRSLSPSRP